MSLLKIYTKSKIEHNKEFYFAPKYSALKVLGKKIPPYFFKSIEFDSYTIELQKLDTDYLKMHEIKIIETENITDTLSFNEDVSYKKGKTNGNMLDYLHFFRLKISLIDIYRTKIYYSDIFCCKTNESAGDYSNDYSNDYEN